MNGGQAVSLSGAGSYGLALPVKPETGNYTISFDVKLNSSTKHTPFIFMGNYDGDTLLGDDSNAEWISIAPQAWQETLSSGPMVWSRNVPGGSSWIDLVPSVKDSLTLNEWHNVTVSVSGASATVYVDKVKAGQGGIADIINDTTRMYLGVNYWDTPLDGAVDNLRLYNSTLSEKQVNLIGESTTE